MGIRFFCPKGHKLNVKEFQAGRRGICPFCGARILIPTQSTRPPSKSVRGQLAANATAQTVEQEDLESAQASDSSPDVLPGEPPRLPGDPTGGKMLSPSTPVGIPAGSGPVVAPPASLTARRGASATPTSPIPDAGVGLGATAARLSSPAGSAPAGVPSAASAAAATIAPTPPGPAAVPAAVVPAAPPAPSQPTAPEPADAIAEAPEMIWYVRPPSGGQFGPASGDLMRTWLTEGRVSADSLVWREGWRDWQEAGTVFPKLRSSSLIDFLEATPVVAVAAAPAAHGHRPKARRSSDGSQIALLAVLSLAVVVLLFVFLWVLFR